MDGKPQIKVVIKCRGDKIALVPYIEELYSKLISAMLSSLRGVEVKEGDVINISIESGGRSLS